MPQRKPRLVKRGINDLTVLAIWLLVAYLVYKADPPGAKQAYSAIWNLITRFLAQVDLTTLKLP